MFSESNNREWLKLNRDLMLSQSSVHLILKERNRISSKCAAPEPPTDSWIVRLLTGWSLVLGISPSTWSSISIRQWLGWASIRNWWYPNFLAWSNCCIEHSERIIGLFSCFKVALSGLISTFQIAVPNSSNSWKPIVSASWCRNPQTKRKFCSEFPLLSWHRKLRVPLPDRIDAPSASWAASQVPVSYTHLTLPTIYTV